MWWDEGVDAPPTPESETRELAMFSDLSLDEPEPYTLRPPTIPTSYTAPLWRITASPDPNTLALETSYAWAIDVPPRASAALVRAMRNLMQSKQLKGGDANGPHSIKHLRSFRKASEVLRGAEQVPGDPALLSALVAMVEAHPDATELRARLQREGAQLPEEAQLYQVRVPSGPAPNRARLREWMEVWPCVFLPPGAGLAKKNSIPGSDAGKALSLVDRTSDNDMWTSPDGIKKSQAVEMALRRCLDNAKRGKSSGEAVGVGVYVTSSSFADQGAALEPIDVDAWDTRTSARHPLRHAVPNAVRKVAALRARSGDNNADAVNGQDYLLTGLTLFISHEPCVYCAMALIHSRVKTVFFVQPSPGSGGFCGAHAGVGNKPQCDGAEDGGPFTVHEQSGLNHHYDVWRWIGPFEPCERVYLDV